MFSSFTKPFSAACERNKGPIAEVLQTYLQKKTGRVLEVGAGTGQHVVHFASLLPHIEWLSTDLYEPRAISQLQIVDQLRNLPGLVAWVVDADLPNIMEPLALDVTSKLQWGAVVEKSPFIAAYSANTAHIMAWDGVHAMFEGVAEALAPRDSAGGGLFFLYGPFNIDGQFTSEGNKSLDAWAKGINPKSGIRDLGDIEALARKNGMRLQNNHLMPANNHLLVFCVSDSNVDA